MRSCTIRWLATLAMLIVSVSAVCNYTTPQSIIDIVACGDREFILECLSAETGVSRLEQIQRCLLKSGCLREEVSSIYNFIIPSCKDALEQPFKSQPIRELKKRASKSSVVPPIVIPSSAASNTRPSTVAATTAKSATPASTTAATATADSSTAVTTTADSTTADTTSVTSSPTTLTTESSTSTDSSSSSSSSTSETSTTATTLTCLATSQIPVTWCFTHTTAAAPATSCTATTVPSIGCAPGLICATQDNGSVTCMVRQNGVTTSGLIVGIVFGVATAGLIASLIFMACRSRMAARKNRRKREAMMAPVIGVAGSGAVKSEDNIPLMANQGPGGGPEDYRGGQRRRGASPYRDVGGSSMEPMPQRLHPGLLDSNPYSGEDEDMGYGRRM